MPRPPETPDVRASKALAYILRHGAEKEGLHIRSDGYVKLDHVLERPKLREVDLSMVLRLVAENAKQRFQLFYGYDPSPPIPKKKKGHQQPKKKKQPLSSSVSRNRNGTGDSKIAEGDIRSGDIESGNGSGSGSGPIEIRSEQSASSQGIDAAQIDNIQSSLSKTTIVDDKPIELPLISLPMPSTTDSSNPSCSEEGETSTTTSASKKGEYFIRATQGHSINLEGTSHLDLLKDDQQGRTKAGTMVHGTKWELWDVLESQGLSTMSRQHIHLAPSHVGTIVPRPNSTLYIYLSLTKLIENDIPVYVSANGVVLTPGNGDGVVTKEYWRKAVKRDGDRRIVVWENGEEIQRDEEQGEEGI
ncbi:uncharacterized protein IL334_006380 [Kwoniella shivajii]|uniref:2'-phosphotransferase n=1 Tax=Kwoniella shivajii TaxID=564305 RepID=A0ABZ1D8V3_9TREE|nr:hypothetical protein IL334_006380 [Kwoniella shivajii]